MLLILMNYFKVTCKDGTKFENAGKMPLLLMKDDIKTV